MKTHIQLKKSPSFKRALVCGAPERAEWISTFLNGAQPIAKNREYHSYLGKYEGKEVLILSHGVGGAGAAICFQELIDAGGETIVRLGTAGGLYEETQIGDLVVATSAVRKDGVSPLMIPLAFPAIADLSLTLRLIEELKSKSGLARAGTIVSTDLFYAGLLPTEFETYRDAGCVAVEMECATLFVIGSLRRVRTAATLVLDGNPLKWKEGAYDPDPNRLKKSMELGLHSALKTLVSS